MKIPERLTFRPGALAGAMENHCESEEIKPSKLIRLALAQYLGVSVPKMDGHIKTIKQVNRAKKKS